ncbi:transcriptional regulator, MarR family [Allomeiothermus silvanus DSM 9946]|uniref:Transcriptional regulator, MarR family n=1 Tax=Allomeiothermus silvanus (strain ATCC 700542 / DSM 9946 / NBRC 106475 / NCIMB 13440 / VI-R2) TaxID=526227 RepID=D7BCS2_ALLS1|nr:MarR family transcriptional regulator [Allomeiothermus silvanus]ADH64655.1 transcriptional regulator, MarR family [Allomeiothermus silvanus DSM 9946]
MPWTVLTRMWKLMRDLRDETLPQLERLGLAPNDPWLLASIEHHHHPTEVVRLTQMPAPTVSQMLKRLEAEGLLVRSLDPSDLRRYHFELTARGYEVLKESRTLLMSAMERRLERLTPEQRRQFVELLDILAQSEGEKVGKE